MAQKKKVPTKSPAKTKPKSRPAAAAKPAKKAESKVAKSAKPPVKVQAAAKPANKPAAKAKSPAKPVAAPVRDGKASAKPVAAKASLMQKPVAAEPVGEKPAAGKTVAKAAPAPASAPELKAAAAVAPKPAPAPAAAPATASVAKPAAPAKPAVPMQPKQMSHGHAPAFRAGPVQFGVSNGAARTVPSALPKAAVRTFPANGAAAPAGAPAMPRDIAQKAVDARQQQVAGAMAGGPKKPVTARHGFKINESIVYPAHGVGRIIGIEEQEIAGMPLELFVIQFEKDKMTLKVPTGKLQTVGMRKLAEDDIVSKAMETLKGRARVKRTMWSRRAQEYEAKINSGDLIAIAEVVRDLFRSESQPEQSYSERQLYEAALDRMAREIAAVARIDERGAVQRITEVLAKSAKGRRAAEVVEPAEGDVDEEGDAKAA